MGLGLGLGPGLGLGLELVVAYTQEDARHEQPAQQQRHGREERLTRGEAQTCE